MERGLIPINRAFRVAAFAWAVCSILAGRAVLADQHEFWVEPGAGSDGDGSREAPFRTISGALLRLEAEAGEATIHLTDALYSIREDFPLRPPLNMDRIALVGPPDGGAHVRRDVPGPVFSIEVLTPSDLPGEPSPPASSLILEIENLTISNSHHGVEVIAPAESNLAVRIRSCTLEGQAVQPIEIVAGKFARVDVQIVDCVIRGPFKYAVDLATRESGGLDLEVVGNRIEGEGESPLRAGISVFAGEAARIRGRIARNRLLRPGDGIVIATGHTEWKAANVDLDIVSNEIVGAPDGSGLRHGLVVSNHHGHVVDASVVHNTVAGGSGHAVFMTLLDKQGEPCGSSDIRIERNVFWTLSGGALGFVDDFEPGCLTLRSNAVAEGDDLASGGFVVSEVDFADASTLDLRPAAGGRLVDVVDAIDVVAPDPELELALDFDVSGNCRRADADADGVATADVGARELIDGATCADALATFVRGDCNDDESLEISDAAMLFNYLFLSPASPACLDACDGNDDAEVNLTDGIYVLNFLFRGGTRPPRPYPESGLDPTADAMLCLKR